MVDDARLPGSDAARRFPRRIKRRLRLAATYGACPQGSRSFDCAGSAAGSSPCATATLPDIRHVGCHVPWPVARCTAAFGMQRCGCPVCICGPMGPLRVRTASGGDLSTLFGGRRCVAHRRIHLGQSRGDLLRRVIPREIYFHSRCCRCRTPQGES